jgi:hypothetical protein
MNDRVRRALDALQRIDSFGTANPDLATKLPVTVELFADVKAAITELGEAGMSRESSTSLGRSETLAKTAVYNEIYADLRIISQTADILERKIPNFPNTFTLPRDKMSTAQLLDKAKAVHADSDAVKAHFIAYGLPEKFREDLQADITALETAAEAQSDAKRTTVGANAAAEDALDAALEARRTLDRILRNHYRSDAQKLAEWLTASRIERAPQKPDDGDQPEPPPAPPVG